MDVVCNKQSGKFFIHINDIFPDRYLLVTPTAEIKALRRDFFDDPLTVDDDDPMLKSMLRKQQRKAYKGYIKNRLNELHEDSANFSPFMQLPEDIRFAIIDQLLAEE